MNHKENDSDLSLSELGEKRAEYEKILADQTAKDTRSFITRSMAIFLFVLIVGGTVFMLSMSQIIRDGKRNEIVNLIEIKLLKLETPVSDIIQLVLKMANSPIIQRHLADPSDMQYHTLALEEIYGYRDAFNGSIFWVSDVDKRFYFHDGFSYIVDTDDPVNYWYNMTVHETESYNLNINYNPDMDEIRQWINAPVFDIHDRTKPIGMVGSGIDLTIFLAAVYENFTAPANIYFFNALGEITGASDQSLVRTKAKVDEHFGATGAEILNIANELGERDDREVRMFSSPLGEVGVAAVSKLGWFAVAVYPNRANDYMVAMTWLFLSMIAVIATILILFNRYIAKYLRSLQISQMKTLELHQLRLEAVESATRAKSNFLATMSHEIRTPMNAIIGISQIELQKNNLPRDHAIALNKIYNSGKALLGIINDILDMSKIEKGKMELLPIDYDVPSLINDTVQLNIVRIGQKQIKFIVDANENLPLQLRGDELRLKQILNNLLSNAIKYTQVGYVKLSVTHEAQEGDDVALRFIVEDTGQGMTREDQEKLFSGYLRFNTEANRNVEGTGIGLTITKKLVELMDGSIEIESEYGKGSKFTVTVRQSAIECGVIGKELAQKLRTFTFADGKIFARQQINRARMPAAKALVVDDVETNLYVAEGMLSPYELQIETAVNGHAAIEKVKNGFVYDVIFMDHMMPLMDGVETTKIIRSLAVGNAQYAHLKSVPIIALTANAVHGVKDMFMQNGFSDFLSKPIDTVELDMILKRWIPQEKQIASEASDDVITNDLTNIVNNDINNFDDDDIIIDGVDVNVGIKRSGGTREKYLRMLSIFMSECNQTIAEIKNALSDNDMESYITRVHGFKSALSNIGATELSELAKKLEDAGRQNDKVFIDDNTQKLFDDFEPILRGIEKVVAMERQKSANMNNNVDMTELSSILNDLLTAINDLDTTAIGELSKRLDRYENVDKIGELLKCVMSGDYDETIKLAREINK